VTEAHPAIVPSPGLSARIARWQARLVASPGFQAWAARFPLTRPFVRRDTQALHDLMSGFVYSQMLSACVDLGVLRALAEGPQRAEALALSAGVSPERMTTLCQAAAALGLMRRRRDGAYRLGRLGAAVNGVPGLEDMIRHHRLFYRDMEDPAALLRGESDTELSRFWPYVRGEGGVAPDVAETYSRLMESSQRMVAAETLRVADLSRAHHLVDIGGGTGAFLEAVAAAYPRLALTLVDLAPVADAARARLNAAGLGQRIAIAPGNFVTDPLPQGADAISLVRVLYDHDDSVVRPLLAKVHAALAPGGRLIVSEPMSGGARPSRAGDAYFGFYTMAMTTGRVRAPERHDALLRDAGFRKIRHLGPRDGIITRVTVAEKD